MKSKANGAVRRDRHPGNVHGEGPNWVLIAGGALLSTLSIRFGCKLRQSFETRQSSSSVRGTGGSAARRRSGGCPSHSNLYCFPQDKGSCYYCLSGISGGGVDVKQVPTTPMSKESDICLPLVKIPGGESERENGSVIWASSPDRRELPQKPFRHSNSSDSPCFSESGSDIYTKREVIHKLREQLKRRDEMIAEMQLQIMDLRSSLNLEMSHSAHLRSQLDSTNQDLFESEREIQQLRKAIADRCVAEVDFLEKPVTDARNWCPESINGTVNGHVNGVDNLRVNCIGLEKERDGERVGILKIEVGELKEVIEGKDFLLQSYREQKAELCSKVKELQFKLASHEMPSIL